MHTDVLLQYPLLITYPKASEYLYNKDKIDIHIDMITESKVTNVTELALQCLRNCTLFE